jgi:hypothetical protein
MSTFTRHDFVTEVVLTEPERIPIDNRKDTPTNPAVFYIIYDSLVVVQNQPYSKELLNIYSLHNPDKPLYSILEGRGPGELLSCICWVESNESPNIYLQDIDTRIFYNINIDSIITNHKITWQEKFEYSPDIHPLSNICLLGTNNFIGYNYWYCDNPHYDNKVSAISLFEKGDSFNEPQMSNMSYFVAPISGAELFVNSHAKQIWAFDLHRDRIGIYDQSLNLIKVVKGPDNLKPKYKQYDAPGLSMPFIGFDNDREYKGYGGFCYTDKHIYAIYYGDANFDNKNMKPVEVFKFDFDGNLICDYKLDKTLIKISVDSKEEYLYGTERSSIDKEASFVRYKL